MENSNVTRKQQVTGGIWAWHIAKDGFQLHYFCDNLRLILGYTRKEMPNSVRSWKKILHPDDFIQNAKLNSNLKLRLLHKDGQIIHVKCQPAKLDAKNFTQYYGIVRIDEPAEKKAPIDDNLNFIAHEIRSPIASIGMAIDFALESAENKMSERSIRLLSGARSSAQNAIAFLENLLDSTNTHSKKAFLSCELYKIANLASEEILFLQPNFTIRNRIDPTITACASPIEIQHVLRNLLSNAIKYRDQKRKLDITIEAVVENGLCQVQVKDNGQGVPDSTLKLLFEKHYREHTHKDIKGHGIGLTFCKRMVEKNGGTIGVIKNRHHGLTFYFSIPLSFRRARNSEPKRAKPAALLEKHSVEP